MSQVHVDKTKKGQDHADVIMKKPPKDQPPTGVYQSLEEPGLTRPPGAVDSIHSHSVNAPDPAAKSETWARKPADGDGTVKGRDQMARDETAKAGAQAATQRGPRRPRATRRTPPRRPRGRSRWASTGAAR